MKDAYLRDGTGKIIGKLDGNWLRDGTGRLLARYDESDDRTRSAAGKIIGTGDQRLSQLHKKSTGR